MANRATKKKRIKVKILPSIQRNISLINDLTSIIKLWKYIKKENFKIVFLHTAKAGVLGRIAAKLAGKNKIIYKVGGFAFNEPRSLVERFVFICIECILSYVTDDLIFVSNYDQLVADKYFIRPKRKHLIYNGVDLDDCQSFIKTISKKRVPTLVTVANFYSTKNHKMAIETAQKLKMYNLKFEWFFVGDGPLKDAIEKEVSSNDLDDVIKFTGYLTSDEVKKFLSNSDLFIITSSKEGMPFAVLEAMKEGVPVISTPVGALPDIINDGVNGFLVSINDTKMLAEKIYTVILNAELREKISNNALRTLINNFSKKNMWKQYKEVFIDIE